MAPEGYPHKKPGIRAAVPERRSIFVKTKKGKREGMILYANRSTAFLAEAMVEFEKIIINIISNK